MHNRSTQNMENMTLLGYLIAIVFVIIAIIKQNFILLIPAVVGIFALRFIGYSMDRNLDKKNRR